MALQILKSSALLPDLDVRYYEYAVVKVNQKWGLKKLFGPRVGSASVSLPQGPAYPLIQVVPPVWKKGQEDEWDILQQCYEKVLQLAAQHHCNAITIPLLTSEDPNFPAYIDFKLAVDTIQAFLEDHPMDVFLICTRLAAFQMPELRNDVERFLSTHFFEEPLPWSAQPFTDYSTRFATIAPCPPSPPRPSMSRPCSASTGTLPSRSELEEMLSATDAGFSETLLKLIDKTGKKDSEIYNKANVSRQHFSKIRNNPDYKPTKPTALAFAIALELDMDETRDLIGRAGYTLTNSSKFDVIIMYFIQRRNYNMFDINATLYEFDQSLLGM